MHSHNFYKATTLEAWTSTLRHAKALTRPPLAFSHPGVAHTQPVQAFSCTPTANTGILTAPQALSQSGLFFP
jgi:hypothetical protein